MRLSKDRADRTERLTGLLLFPTLMAMSSTAFSLIICLPGEAPARHDLTDETIAIGRSPENGLQLLVAEVSVKHGSVSRSGDTFTIADSGSTNGTTVNGTPVESAGVNLNPMDKIVFGTLVPAYFVPSAVLDSTPMEELIASIESAAGAAAEPKTAPIATAVRAALPVAAEASPGATTVKLDQVRGPAPAPGGVRPAPVPLRQPLPVSPGGGPPRPPGAPAPPSAPRPAGAQLANPPAAPAGGVPQPIPLKRPAPGAPTIPLPKLPPKPGN